MRGLGSDFSLFDGGTLSQSRSCFRDLSLPTLEPRVCEESGEGYEIGGVGDLDPMELSSEERSVRSLLLSMVLDGV